MKCEDIKDNSFSTCDKRNVFIASESNRKYSLINTSGKLICKVKIDGGYIQDMTIKKCDYLFFVCQEDYLIFVELKGADFISAVEQILSTISVMKTKLEMKTVSARIVLSKVNVPNLQNNPKFLKLKREIEKKRNGNIIYKARILEEQY